MTGTVAAMVSVEELRALSNPAPVKLPFRGSLPDGPLQGRKSCRHIVGATGSDEGDDSDDSNDSSHGNEDFQSGRACNELGAAVIGEGSDVDSCTGSGINVATVVGPRGSNDCGPGGMPSDVDALKEEAEAMEEARAAERLRDADTRESARATALFHQRVRIFPSRFLAGAPLTPACFL